MGSVQYAKLKLSVYQVQKSLMEEWWSLAVVFTPRELFANQPQSIRLLIKMLQDAHPASVDPSKFHGLFCAGEWRAEERLSRLQILFEALARPLPLLVRFERLSPPELGLKSGLEQTGC